MAEPLNPTHQNHSWFLGCFGFPMNKKSRPKPIQKKTRSLWQMFRLSPTKSITKTLPVNNADKAKVDHAKTKTKTSKPIKKKLPDSTKSSSKPHIPSRQNSKAGQRLASTNQIVRETTKEVGVQVLKLESIRLVLALTVLLPYNFWINISLFQTWAAQGSPSEPTRSRSLPDSVVTKAKPKPKKTQTVLSHTVSLPVLEGSQRVGNNGIHAPPVNSKDLRLDNIALGMSVIVVTLIIMLVWGRLCAILCTSAWLYFCPRFRTRVNGNVSSSSGGGGVESTQNLNDSYLNSKEYKKKVVLEGLLHRNNRITL
ncbi:hypothetical protein Goarm_006803 [Gossypium armourianum]|uniref:Uncharacterized protein n=1 Tax=Gossypium armourianum TaxID=34283 RepID=A0A7J9JJ58_9ROSI|nr:hypothetical protein [Gossypium armourianum]